eukprot:Blabericola_migrator_1__7812@NODE_39_length_17554_cov_37_506147_g35_i0_p6_GENE_NODE_39_length_17554_cov_37_506147_g35_i0NODE_39_length_17554_cov_37_506147_g35_i0_p6_ORF_typecomplete_len410_score65_20Pro_isomerase/PF00160_21/2_4e29Pro_isomerase/PF00160_21/5_9e10MNNL/PF07657_13/0_099TetR_C_14/PF17754_1/0_17_NODE_39_length_17554_cov_37_506147_g35_i061647393
MSEIYTLEPPNNGKVVLKTTVGPIEIDLWAKECPKACRNFVQLCLEGYYDGCLFHRVLPGFLVQTGDPTGTGTGGENIYGESFPNEYHSRLKFRYRGLVGVATTHPDSKIKEKVPTELDPLGQDDEIDLGKPYNGSQFFLTLDRADGLNGKNTMFGKVTGPTIWNLARIGESETDALDRPLEPICITSTEVLWNPFDDIVPRQLPKKLAEPVEDEAPKDMPIELLRPNLVQKHHALLSFIEDEDQDEQVVMTSAHDLLSDPALLKEEVPKLSATEDKLAALKARIAQKSGDVNLPPQDLDAKREAEERIEAAEIAAAEEAESKSVIAEKGPTEESTAAFDHWVGAEYGESAIKDSRSIRRRKKGMGTNTKIERDLMAVQDADLMNDRVRKCVLHTTSDSQLSGTAKGAS